MKRLLCIFIILVLALSLLALPISADEATTEASNEESADLSNEESTDSSDEESTDSSNEENKGFFEKAADFFSNAKKFFSFPIQMFNWNVISIDGEGINLTLREGGFNYVSESSPINTAISAVYKVIYPIGFIIMILCWAFGIAKSTISASLDIKDKNSIIHSVIGLIIGVAAMSLAPQILTTLTGISRWLCNSIFDQSVFATITEKLGSVTALNIQGIINSTSSNKVLFTTIVLLVVDLIFMINILWIALLQCLSPIFVGLMANEGTRKIGFNFIKEYFKALLVPSVTLIYFFLASTLAGVAHAGGIIVALVLAISTLGIAGKKLDKLIN